MSQMAKNGALLTASFEQADGQLLRADVHWREREWPTLVDIGPTRSHNQLSPYLPIGLSPYLRRTSSKASAINACRFTPFLRAQVCNANDISGEK